jgi:hypothetical protein
MAVNTMPIPTYRCGVTYQMRRPRLLLLLAQSSSASRFTAGFLILSQSSTLPER